MKNGPLKQCKYIGYIGLYVFAFGAGSLLKSILTLLWVAVKVLYNFFLLQAKVETRKLPSFKKSLKDEKRTTKF